MITRLEIYGVGILGALLIILGVWFTISRQHHEIADLKNTVTAQGAQLQAAAAQGNVTSAAAAAADNSLSRTVYVRQKAESAAAVVQHAVGADTAVPQSVQDATLAGVAEQRNEVGR